MKQVALASAVVVVAIVAVAAPAGRARPGVGAETPAPTNPTLPSVSVTLAAGWNMMDELDAYKLTAQHSLGPAYTYAAGDSNYRAVVFDGNHPPAFQPVGPAYWVYVPAPIAVSEPFIALMVGSLHVNLGWTMVASEAGAALRVQGADTVLVYDPTSATYQANDRVGAGKGAWVYSAAGADISFTP